MDDMQASVAVLMQKVDEILALHHSHLCVVEHLRSNLAGAAG
jgi:hypothetical protein